MTINPWRGEVAIVIAGETLACNMTMDKLARIFADLGVETLHDLHRKWDSLNPEAMRRTLEFVAVDVEAAKRLFPSVAGARGLSELHAAFYQLASGMTPDEIAAETEARKKLAGLPAGIAQAIVAGLAANPAMAALVE